MTVITSRETLWTALGALVLYHEALCIHRKELTTTDDLRINISILDRVQRAIEEIQRNI